MGKHVDSVNTKPSTEDKAWSKGPVKDAKKFTRGSKDERFIGGNEGVSEDSLYGYLDGVKDEVFKDGFAVKGKANEGKIGGNDGKTTPDGENAPRDDWSFDPEQG